jgi:hypothetical protein
MLVVTVIPIAVSIMLFISLPIYNYIMVNMSNDDTMDEDINKYYTVPENLSDAFNNSTIKYMREVFNFYDEDSSGNIDKREIAKVIHEFDPAITDAEVESQIQEFFAEAGADGSGLIDFSKFLTVIHKARNEKRASKFATLVEKVETRIRSGPKQTIFYLFLMLTYLVLVSTSANLFNYLQCQDFPLPEGEAKSFMFKVNRCDS